MSTVSQREFTFSCLPELLFKVSVVISKKSKILCFLEPGSWIGQCVIASLFFSFALKESMSGLINEGSRENDMVFWPEIE